MPQIFKKHLLAIAFSLLTLGSATSAMAIPTISYTAHDLGSGNWEYNYTINNDLVGQAIDSFTVDFAYGLYSALQLDFAPTGWGNSSYVIDLSNALNSTDQLPSTLYGFADASNSYIAPGSFLSGFTVSFKWNLTDADPDGVLLSPPLDSGAGVLALGDQAFSYTFVDFPTDAPAPVPEPSAILLIGLGLAGLAGYRKLARSK
jgi:hypothetical protein